MTLPTATEGAAEWPDEQTLREEAARDFKVRLLWFLGSGPGAALAVFVANLCLVTVRGEALPLSVTQALLGLCLAAGVGTSFRLGFRRCPRCDHFWNLGNIYARRCATCGLSR